MLFLVPHLQAIASGEAGSQGCGLAIPTAHVK